MQKAAVLSLLLARPDQYNITYEYDIDKNKGNRVYKCVISNSKKQIIIKIS